MIPPIAGVMIYSYWVSNKANPVNWRPVKKYNRIGLISWLAGSVIAAGPVILSFFGVTITSNPLFGMIISFIVFGILNKLATNKEKVGNYV